MDIKLKEYLKTIEEDLKKNSYIAGEKLTLADILLFRYLRFFMMLHFPEGMRKSLFPQTTKWFEKIMKSPEAVKAYGRTVLCKNPLKAFTGEIKRCPILPPKKEKEHGKEKEKEKEKEHGKEKTDPPRLRLEFGSECP